MVTAPLLEVFCIFKLDFGLKGILWLIELAQVDMILLDNSLYSDVLSWQCWKEVYVSILAEVSRKKEDTVEVLLKSFIIDV